MYDGKESNRSHQAWFVLAHFNPLPFLNDPWYLEGDSTQWLVRNTCEEPANVDFLQKQFPESPAYMEQPYMISVRTFQSI